MADLTARYMGLDIKNPVVVGASGLTADLHTIKRIEEAGAGAIVCKSLFEEEIQLESLKFDKELHQYDDLHAEMITIYPPVRFAGPDEHLVWINNVRKAVNIPVIGSLNAVHDDVWFEYAEKMEQTGVDGLELNFYYDHTPGKGEGCQREKSQLELLKRIRDRITIPIGVKISPYYSDIRDFLEQIDRIGINGMVLFNRLFQMDIHTEKEDFYYPFSFSHKQDNRLPMRYAGLLYGRVDSSLICSSGILDGEDIVKMILAGADAVQIVSTLYRNGVSFISQLLSDVSSFMDRKNYTRINDFKGKLSRKNTEKKDVWAYKRTQYVKMLMQAGEELAGQIF